MTMTHASGRKPNLVLLGVDSLRADHMSCYGYPGLTTPHHTPMQHMMHMGS